MIGFFLLQKMKVKERIIKEFKSKIKYLNPYKKINFDYNGTEFFTQRKDVVGDLVYAKNYVMNIYILSKCIDIILVRGSGAAGVVIISEGFRNSLVYNLGTY